MKSNRRLAGELMRNIRMQTSPKTKPRVCSNDGCNNAIGSREPECVDCLWLQLSSLAGSELATNYVKYNEGLYDYRITRLKACSDLANSIANNDFNTNKQTYHDFIGLVNSEKDRPESMMKLIESISDPLVIDSYISAVNEHKRAWKLANNTRIKILECFDA